MTTVAIIGSGFSGTLLAYTLAKGAPDLEVSLFEQRERVATGVAYGTKSPHHLLNVPAGRMSAFDSDPSHFLRWWQMQEPAANEHAFAPRMIYGQYLQSLLAEVADRITIHHEQVVRVTPSDTIETNQARHRAQRIVFATGNYPPHDPLARWLPSSTERYFANPWGIETLPLDTFGDAVCIVGTGLTAIDVVIDLVARGYTGTFSMVSRRGLLPEGHSSMVRPSMDPAPIPALSSLSRLTRWARSEIARAEKSGADWRVVVDSLRPHTQALWGNLSPQQKQSFLRHLRPFWDTHRHRVAPELHGLLQKLRAANRLRVHSGRIQSVEDTGTGYTVTLRTRGSTELEELHCSSLVNCTGPAGDLKEIPDPLLQSILRQGIGTVDETGLGLATTSEGMLVNSSGETDPQFWAMGPLRKGTLWECTAVRELRGEVSRLAQTLRLSAEGPAEVAPQVANTPL